MEKYNKINLDVVVNDLFSTDEQKSYEAFMKLSNVLTESETISEDYEGFVTEHYKKLTGA